MHSNHGDSDKFLVFFENMPYYKIDKLKEACRKRNVVFIGSSVTDATYFGFIGKEAVCSYLVSSMFKPTEFVNSKPWENNPDPDHEIIVDAYHFMVEGKTGYLAFFYNDRTQKWIIKSFHRELNTTDTYHPFRNLKILE